MNATCQCGAVQFKTPLSKPLAVYICHCDECRRQSTSAFGCSAMFPRFELPCKEALGCFTRPTATGNILNCYFCTSCGVRILHSTPGKEVVSVKGGCLNGLDWKSARHIWCKRAVVPIPEGVERDEGEPVEGDGESGDRGEKDKVKDKGKEKEKGKEKKTDLRMKLLSDPIGERNGNDRGRDRAQKDSFTEGGKTPESQSGNQILRNNNKDVPSLETHGGCTRGKNGQGHGSGSSRMEVANSLSYSLDDGVDLGVRPLDSRGGNTMEEMIGIGDIREGDFRRHGFGDDSRGGSERGTGGGNFRQRGLGEDSRGGNERGFEGGNIDYTFHDNSGNGASGNASVRGVSSRERPSITGGDNYKIDNGSAMMHGAYVPEAIFRGDNDHAMPGSYTPEGSLRGNVRRTKSPFKVSREEQERITDQRVQEVYGKLNALELERDRHKERKMQWDAHLKEGAWPSSRDNEGNGVGG